jgi:hypothetical protein
MKTILVTIVTLLSFNTFSATCFERTTDMSTFKLDIPKKLCIQITNFNFDAFGTSTVDYFISDSETSNFTSRISALKGKSNSTGQYLVQFVVASDDSNPGATCDDKDAYSVSVLAKVTKFGKILEVKMSGSTLSTYDTCHSKGTSQEIIFDRVI